VLQCWPFSILKEAFVFVDSAATLGLEVSDAAFHSCAPARAIQVSDVLRFFSLGCLSFPVLQHEPSK